MSPAAVAPRVALTGVKAGPGGIPRVLANLVTGMVEAGVAVDVLCGDPGRMDLAHLPAATRLVGIGTATDPAGMHRLARYFRATRPDAIISNRERGRLGILAARALSGVHVTVAFRVGNPVSVHLGRRHWHQRLPRQLAIRIGYPRADRIIAVSAGIARDVMKMVPACRERVVHLANPVFSPAVETLARQPVDHPWLVDAATPVIVAAGRLARQKDFPTLLRACARLLSGGRRLRLIILGEGKERQALQAQARELGIHEQVDLPGFVGNPFAYMRKAALFVLSSAWEGSPNVLIEALAVGVPVVATDCLSGPREILEEGRLGPLVPVGDDAALAAAIGQVLDAPLPRDTLIGAAAAYRIDRSTGAYLRALGIAGPGRA